MAKKPDTAASMAVTHGFALARVSAGLRNEALAVLVDLNGELKKIIEHGDASPVKSKKYVDMQNEAAATIQQAYDIMAKQNAKDLSKVSAAEWDFSNKMLNKTIGVEVFNTKIPPRLLETLAHGPNVFGHSSSDWWQGQSAELRSKFRGQMVMGTLLGEGVQDLVKRVISSGIVQGGPGIMTKAKRDAASLVISSVNSISNATRIQAFIDKPGTVKGLSWLSTLDGRTTPICIALSGKQWRLPDFEPIGHDKKFPGPTAHWRCRSTQLAVLYSWSELAGKKIPELDGATVQKKLEDKLHKMGWSDDQIASVKANTQASMDGQVQGDLTYEQWANDKGDEFVTQVIGPGRAALYNAGKMSFSDLTNQDNRPLTLAQLQHAIETDKLPPETLGTSTFNPPPKVGTQAAAQKAAQAAADAAKAAAQAEAAKVLEAQRKAAEEAAQAAAIQAAADSAKAAAAAKKLAEEQAAQAAAEAEVAAKAAALKAAQEAAKLEASKQKKMKTISTKMASYKELTKGEQAFMKTLDEADNAQMDTYTLAAEAKLAKAAAKTAAQKPVTTAAPDIKGKNLDLYIPDPSTLTFVKSLPGSTAPALMVDPATGKQWVVKTSTKLGHLKSEAAADEVYRLLGAKATGSAFVESGGKGYKIAEYIPDAQTLGAWSKGKTKAQIAEKYADVRKNFVLDTLLGNWDVAGQGNDNLLVVGSDVLRIDNGGAFNYRAQGALKTAKEFGANVEELKTMRQKGVAAGKTAEIFGPITQAEIDQQSASLVARRAEIVALVHERLGPEVAKTIGQRLDYLEAQLPSALRTAPKSTAASASLEFAPKFETAARTRYGASLALGDATFEDQQVIVWHEQSTAKAAFVKAQGTLTMKASDEFAAKMQKEGFAAVPAGKAKSSYTSVVSAAPVHPEDDYFMPFVNAAKTVSAHSDDGKYNLATIKTFELSLKKATDHLAVLGASIDPGTKAMLTHYLDAGKAIAEALATKTKVKATVKRYDYKAPAPNAAATGSKVINGVTVSRMDVPVIDYTVKELVGDKLVDTGVRNRDPNMPAAYKLSRGNVEVTVIPYAPDANMNGVARTYQGNVRINVKGDDSKAAMQEASAMLRDVGLLDVEQATRPQRELVYLQKGAYLAGDTEDAKYKAALALPDEAKRLEALKVWAEKKYDITIPRTEKNSRYWNPDGEISDTGVGHRFWRRFDITEDEGKVAEAGSSFYHSSSRLADAVTSMLQGGGQATTTWQRLRTGVPLSTGGASSDHDLDAGGGNYFYTNRIAKGQSVKAGIVFKGDSVTRLDIASHTYDSFGAWEANGSKMNARRRTLDKITQPTGTGISTNTGLFKNGLHFDQVDVIKAGSAKAAKELIDRLKGLGITAWPDGRALKDIIKA